MERSPNPLSPSAIFPEPGSHPWCDRLLVLEETDSTNLLAKAEVRKGAPGGTVIVADRQTAGRGRLGRTFLSPGDVGVYFSAILRPACPPQELMHLTCAVAVAMCDAVEASYGFRPGIKWTNDLVYEGKKLGGILTELCLNPKNGLVDAAIVGVGINCRQERSDFDPSIRDMACSARMILGKDVDRNRLIGEMIRAMACCDRDLRTGQEEMLRRYRRDCVTLGKEISIVRGEEVRHGVALDLDSDGGLIVRLDSGEIQTVSSGEVSIRGLYGYI